MSRGNNHSRKQARSRRKMCKPGRWTTEEYARKFLDRLAETEPEKALGMIPYECEKCNFWHIGRGTTR